MHWYAVTGRIPGDDEDTCHIFQADSRDEAVGAFEAAMYDGVSPETHEYVTARYESSVYVTTVLVSATEIKEA